MDKLNAKELRLSEPTKLQLAEIKRRPIYIVCDNVLDTYNIGSIFRLADAVAASKVYLCGQSEIPPNGRIAKASVGTDKWVPWEYKETAVAAIGRVRELESDRVKVIAIEQHAKAKDYRKINYDLPIVFVLGHETNGLSRQTLAACDEIVEIPMFGVNKSLNVMVSLAIVLYKVV